ncbi:MAG: hypothetical protein A2140_03155 [Candidatus Muproteobacteria bacterium RBG_16_62_13]|uniref:DUF2782 domain-containing protein n=1 Tax=Candidatus Muproteobacteria bacterium RBG_16_62_13 TaxID=1817756 RepID=A0A1F6T4S8_9PROT|nr:MAG: hypothetical protein A2140_03155 [Candidatus Muproteobacteria bacterium RBG_16_62_13]
MKIHALIVIPLALLLAAPAFAADQPEPAKTKAGKATVPAPPPIPPAGSYKAKPEPPADQPADLEPVVTITTRGDDLIEEYRMNGKLYMVKVTPGKGKPYYLIDPEGKGEFRRSDLQPSISVPTWVIKRF